MAASPSPTNLVPLNDFVLVEEEAYVPYEQYKGYTHIIVPDKFAHGPEDRPVIGRIIAKGRHCIRSEVQGRVALGKWSGARFHQDGKTYVVVKEEDVLAVLE